MPINACIHRQTKKYKLLFDYDNKDEDPPIINSWYEKDTYVIVFSIRPTKNTLVTWWAHHVLYKVNIDLICKYLSILNMMQISQANIFESTLATGKELTIVRRMMD